MFRYHLQWKVAIAYGDVAQSLVGQCLCLTYIKHLHGRMHRLFSVTFSLMFAYSQRRNFQLDTADRNMRLNYYDGQHRKACHRTYTGEQYVSSCLAFPQSLCIFSGHLKSLGASLIRF